MWGDGGRVYWGRRLGEAEGVVVVFSGLSSREKDPKPLLDLYSSLGWSSLVCHSDFFTLFFTEKATRLACEVLNELIKEVKIRTLPIILAAFSGGPKGCMCKVLQLIEGKCEGLHSLDEYQLVRDCTCAQIYDSSPVDFTSDLCSRFALRPPRVVSWMARALASSLDSLFINKSEAQHAEYWLTLQLSVRAGPILILCSEDDEITPVQVVYDFAQQLQELGGYVRVVEWNKLSHLGRNNQHPADYKAAVVKLLGEATAIYSQRRQQLNGETLGLKNSANSLCNLNDAALSSNENLRQVAVSPSDHLFLPSSLEFDDAESSGKAQDKQKSESFQIQNPPGVGAHGVLGQILFEACVPKNIEGWDIKPAMSLNRGQTLPASRRHGPFNPIKCIRRSKL